MWEIISLFDLTRIKSMVDHGAISVKTQRIGIGCSLEKEFNELCMNCSIIYQIVNQVDSSQDCVCGPFT